MDLMKRFKTCVNCGVNRAFKCIHCGINVCHDCRDVCVDVDVEKSHEDQELFNIRMEDERLLKLYGL